MSPSPYHAPKAPKTSISSTGPHCCPGEPCLGSTPHSGRATEIDQFGPSNQGRCEPREECPEGPSTQYLRTLVSTAVPFMVFGTRVLKYWVLGHSKTLGKNALAAPTRGSWCRVQRRDRYGIKPSDSEPCGSCPRLQFPKCGKFMFGPFVMTGTQM